MRIHCREDLRRRLDRALTQLVRSGWLDGVRGIAVGEFTDCGDPRQVRAVLDRASRAIHRNRLVRRRWHPRLAVH